MHHITYIVLFCNIGYSVTYWYTAHVYVLLLGDIHVLQKPNQSRSWAFMLQFLIQLLCGVVVGLLLLVMSHVFLFVHFCRAWIEVEAGSAMRIDHPICRVRENIL